MESHIFVIYAAEDHMYFDRLAEQARAARASVTFERMQSKQPWVPTWKGQCRTRIFNADGVILLLSKRTQQSSGISWELDCARESQAPMLAIHVEKDDQAALPDGLMDATVIAWNWPDIARFIASVKRPTTKSYSA